MSELGQFWLAFKVQFSQLLSAQWQSDDFLLQFVPFVLFLELPLYLVIWLGMFRYVLRQSVTPPYQLPYYPKVSCIITCYSEGPDVGLTLNSLLEQDYPGLIELIPVIDGAIQNRHTLEAAQAYLPRLRQYPRRRLNILPKWQRGGRVSSLNAGLLQSSGEIVMALDGDTSFDNDMVSNAVRNFRDPTVIGVAGSLRLRNANASQTTRLQALEYLLSIHASKVGLSEWNVLNNISGAFGIFRRSFLMNLGGWDAGTAEDLDMTLRLKQYFGRHPELKILFEPRAMAHTDGPVSFGDFLKQRLRWDGDLHYLYFRKHWRSFSASLLGWRNLIFTVWYGLVFQVMLPFLILVYTAYLPFQMPGPALAAIYLLIYLFYVLITLINFVLFLVLISERKRQDLWLLPYVLVFPAFAFVTRCWSAVAILHSWLNRAHLDSSMAPFWVLKRGRF